MTTMIRVASLSLILLSTVCAFGASLWTGASKPLWADTRARAVGDLLTVVITQESSSSTQATHSTDKTIDTNAGAGTGWLSGFTGFTAKADRTTSGVGSAVASTSVVDTVTVRIVELLPNGTCRIEGLRTIRLEKDEMQLVFSGIIRPEDIQTDNSISSVMVADQRLETKGQGPIAEKQKPGLFSRLLSFLW